MKDTYPLWLVILLTTIPATASILVAYVSNRKSRKAEKRADDIGERSISRDELTTVIDKYKELNTEREKEISELRGDLKGMEDRLKYMREELQLERDQNTKLRDEIIKLQTEILQVQRKTGIVESDGKSKSDNSNNGR